ncbi:putative glycosidase CRH2 [Vermiconidia calcicola]|uniref:Glycosidase CRH2 n=1 Tax=Vermiconidia calcicola TaxID=1690605 RepID=A0ACC3MM19_9PEZI|nr:putative glycosidase CRH2 [Vermiconidia calcicola]
MRQAFSAAAALAATFSLTTSAQTIPRCGPGSPCPKDTPCCSQYGQCGVGAYCLGGCDPEYSFTLDSCMAAPVCKSADYKLISLDGIESNTQYLGDASDTNWVVSGLAVPYQDKALLLTMAPDTVGTLLMSTHYVWYGKVSATMTTSQGQGVVSAFILMSDVKDEIDFEFIGVDLTHAQTNFYFQGITDYNNGDETETSNTVQEMHTYTIDWQPDYVSWAIDGEVGRTVYKNDTWNSTDNKYHFPQTPSRVQLSLWPAGLPTNGQGTIDWAGGEIDWDSPYMQNGYYFAQVQDISVECYDPPADVQRDGDSAYYYLSTEGMEDDVAIGDKNTVLGSLYATGDKPDFDPSDDDEEDSPEQTQAPETVPGISGGGSQQLEGQGAGEAGGSGSAASSAAGSSPTGGSTYGFTQGGTSQASTVYAGSAVALLGFFVAALML